MISTFIEEIKPKKGSIYIAHVYIEKTSNTDFIAFRNDAQKQLKKFFGDKRFIIDYCIGNQKVLDIEVIQPTRRIATKIDYLRYFFKIVSDKVKKIEEKK